LQQAGFTQQEKLQKAGFVKQEAMQKAGFTHDTEIEGIRNKRATDLQDKAIKDRQEAEDLDWERRRAAAEYGQPDPLLKDRVLTPEDQDEANRLRASEAEIRGSRNLSPEDKKKALDEIAGKRQAIRDRSAPPPTYEDRVIKAFGPDIGQQLIGSKTPIVFDENGQPSIIRGWKDPAEGQAAQQEKQEKQARTDWEQRQKDLQQRYEDDAADYNEELKQRRKFADDLRKEKDPEDETKPAYPTAEDVENAVNNAYGGPLRAKPQRPKFEPYKPAAPAAPAQGAGQPAGPAAAAPTQPRKFDPASGDISPAPGAAPAAAPPTPPAPGVQQPAAQAPQQPAPKPAAPQDLTPSPEVQLRLNPGPNVGAPEQAPRLHDINSMPRVAEPRTRFTKGRGKWTEYDTELFTPEAKRAFESKTPEEQAAAWKMAMENQENKRIWATPGSRYFRGWDEPRNL
jgi:hypothetical protein